MRKQLLIGSSILGICLTSWVLLKKSPADLERSKDLQTAPIEQRIGSKDLASSSPSFTSQDIKASPTLTDSKRQSESVALDPQVISQLENYHSLNEKTFLTASEDADKKKMLKNPEVLKMTAQILKNVQLMKDPKFEENQNRAIDLLLEALTAGDQAMAVQEITALIQDPQVENADLPQDVRETLAGIKAELLYHATAMDSQSFQQIESLLPGNVSQKIWKNVQEKQQENFAESLQEMQSQQSQAQRK